MFALKYIASMLRTPLWRAHMLFAVLLVVGAWMLAMGIANAADVAPAASVALAPVWGVVDMVAQDAGTLLLPLIAAWLGRHVRNELLRRALLDAVQHEAQGIYGALVGAGHAYTDLPVRNVAIAQAVNSLTSGFPTAMRALGKSPDDLNRMVMNAMGGLLAVDPSVTITPASRQPPNPPVA